MSTSASSGEIWEYVMRLLTVIVKLLLRDLRLPMVTLVVITVAEGGSARLDDCSMDV